MSRIYKDDGKIKTKPKDESSSESGKNEREKGSADSLTHSKPNTEGESGSESADITSDKDPSNLTHSLTHTRKEGLSESVNQGTLKKADSPTDSPIEDGSKKVKCPYCDYEDHPFFLKIHRKNEHEGGL